ncbi:hypothetical protein ACFO5R_20910 [Halosolutus amylolyticus]|uniref:Uncharacterized protein n=1 Tax=Halosolutus amylolyticus TaxID=2932267 RepID=A0ABD5PWN0_9EURY|nr:hypothetical protein [Halosolutus amylolyticus]
MRSLPVELDEETFEALEMERRLIGFDSRAAYVEWIVEHRASITEEADGAERLLETYRERIAQLEARLAEQADRDGRNARSIDSDPESAPDLDRDGSVPADRSADTAAEDDDETTGPNESRPRADADGGWTRSKSHPSIEVRGSPRTTISRDRSGDAVDATGTTGCESKPTGDDGNGGSAGADASGLTPERVVRISEDPVSEDADVLETVAFDRLDELSRRAVAKTRSRLNRSVETGLEYRSSTALVDDSVRPGEDVVDLDSLSVPGHDDEVTAARREVAGRAVAFLRDEGRARKSDFVDALYESHPAGYETADSWWACLKRALKQVDAIEGGDGSRVWRFTG